MRGRLQDIIKVRNGKVQGTMQDPVSKHMTTPAITSEWRGVLTNKKQGFVYKGALTLVPSVIGDGGGWIQCPVPVHYLLHLSQVRMVVVVMVFRPLLLTHPAFDSSSPPLHAVSKDATVQQAADLMLASLLLAHCAFDPPLCCVRTVS